MLGRWSLTAPLFEDAPPAGPRLRALAELMLERHGIVTRETAIAEGIPGGFAAIYGELQNLELLGTARRGYFVEGLGGAQFALPGAVERLRSLPRPDGELLWLAATDPANPYGATLPVAEAGGQPPRGPDRGRVPGDSRRRAAALRRARRQGRSCGWPRSRARSWRPRSGDLAAAARDGKIEKLALERLDGEPVIGSEMETALVAAGFRRQPRRLVA